MLRFFPLLIQLLDGIWRNWCNFILFLFLLASSPPPSFLLLLLPPKASTPERRCNYPLGGASLSLSVSVPVSASSLQTEMFVSSFLGSLLFAGRGEVGGGQREGKSTATARVAERCNTNWDDTWMIRSAQLSISYWLVNSGLFRVITGGSCVELLTGQSELDDWISPELLGWVW